MRIDIMWDFISPKGRASECGEGPIEAYLEEAGERKWVESSLHAVQNPAKMGHIKKDGDAWVASFGELSQKTNSSEEALRICWSWVDSAAREKIEK